MGRRKTGKGGGGKFGYAEADAYEPPESPRQHTILYIKHLYIARVAGAASLRDATPAFIRLRLKLSTFGSFLFIFSRLHSEPR